MLKRLAVLSMVMLPMATACADPSQVIVVRHAERATQAADANDPPLSPPGTQRAAALADMLAAANVRSILVTQYRRTQETAAPLAKRLGVAPVVVAARRGEHAAHVAEVVAAVRKQSGVVLVVGHSNTVGEIVAALSSSMPAPLCDTTYANLFVVTSGALPALQLKYGAPDAPPSSGCQ